MKMSKQQQNIIQFHGDPGRSSKRTSIDPQKKNKQTNGNNTTPDNDDTMSLDTTANVDDDHYSGDDKTSLGGTTIVTAPPILLHCTNASNNNYDSREDGDDGDDGDSTTQSVSSHNSSASVLLSKMKQGGKKILKSPKRLRHAIAKRQAQARSKQQYSPIDCPKRFWSPEPNGDNNCKHHNDAGKDHEQTSPVSPLTLKHANGTTTPKVIENLNNNNNSNVSQANKDDNDPCQLLSEAERRFKLALIQQKGRNIQSARENLCQCLLLRKQVLHTLLARSPSVTNDDAQYHETTIEMVERLILDVYLHFIQMTSFEIDRIRNGNNSNSITTPTFGSMSLEQCVKEEFDGDTSWNNDHKTISDSPFIQQVRRLTAVEEGSFEHSGHSTTTTLDDSSPSKEHQQDDETLLLLPGDTLYHSYTNNSKEAIHSKEEIFLGPRYNNKQNQQQYYDSSSCDTHQTNVRACVSNKMLLPLLKEQLEYVECAIDFNKTTLFAQQQQQQDEGEGQMTVHITLLLLRAHVSLQLAQVQTTTVVESNLLAAQRGQTTLQEEEEETLSQTQTEPRSMGTAQQIVCHTPTDERQLFRRAYKDLETLTAMMNVQQEPQQLQQQHYYNQNHTRTMVPIIPALFLQMGQMLLERNLCMESEMALQRAIQCCCSTSSSFVLDNDDGTTTILQQLQSKALFLLGTLCFKQGDYHMAAEYLEESLRLLESYYDTTTTSDTASYTAHYDYSNNDEDHTPVNETLSSNMFGIQVKHLHPRQQPNLIHPHCDSFMKDMWKQIIVEGDVLSSLFHRHNVIMEQLLRTYLSLARDSLINNDDNGSTAMTCCHKVMSLLPEKKQQLKQQRTSHLFPKGQVHQTIRELAKLLKQIGDAIVFSTKNDPNNDAGNSHHNCDDEPTTTTSLGFFQSGSTSAIHNSNVALKCYDKALNVIAYANDVVDDYSSNKVDSNDVLGSMRVCRERVFKSYSILLDLVMESGIQVDNDHFFTTMDFFDMLMQMGNIYLSFGTQNKAEQALQCYESVLGLLLQKNDHAAADSPLRCEPQEQEQQSTSFSQEGESITSKKEEEEEHGTNGNVNVIDHKSEDPKQIQHHHLWIAARYGQGRSLMKCKKYIQAQFVFKRLIKLQKQQLVVPLHGNSSSSSSSFTRQQQPPIHPHSTQQGGRPSQQQRQTTQPTVVKLSRHDTTTKTNWITVSYALNELGNSFLLQLTTSHQNKNNCISRQHQHQQEQEDDNTTVNYDDDDSTVKSISKSVSSSSSYKYNLKAAMICYKESVQLKEQLLGMDDHSTLDTKLNYVRCLCRMAGQTEEDEYYYYETATSVLLHEVLPIQRNQYYCDSHPKHLKLVETLDLLCSIYYKQQNYKEALVHCNESIQLLVVAVNANEQQQRHHQTTFHAGGGGLLLDDATTLATGTRTTISGAGTGNSNQQFKLLCLLLKCYLRCADIYLCLERPNEAAVQCNKCQETIHTLLRRNSSSSMLELYHTKINRLWKRIQNMNSFEDTKQDHNKILFWRKPFC